MSDRRDYDVIVIGGGHAGVEAVPSATVAPAAAGRTPRVAMVTMDPSHRHDVVQPAIEASRRGWSGDRRPRRATGEVADATGIMFRMLNTIENAGPRPLCQNDKEAYRLEVQRRLSRRPGST